MKFVIIGGDAAGMSAASRAKRNNPDIEVTVLEKTMDVSYSACGMPYNIADPSRSIEELVVRTAEEFRTKNSINLLTGHRVDKIDPVNKIVSGIILSHSICKEFMYPFDKLLIATGAEPIIPNIEGFDFPEVMPLKSLEHGRKIKSFILQNSIDKESPIASNNTPKTHLIKPVKKALIIGMGYIGLEMCEALRKLSIDVAMVKPGNQFLPWMNPQLADVVRQELDINGVEIYSGYKINKIERLENSGQKSNGSIAVICEDVNSNKKITLNTDMVITASGVKPCSELAVNAGIKTGVSGAVEVDKTLKTSIDNIYAAGDCADSFHVVTGKKCWIPLALRANRSGWAAADNVCGIETVLDGVAGTAVFKLFELQAARTGITLNEAVSSGLFDPVEAVVKTRSKAHAHPGSKDIYVSMVGDKRTGQLLGVQMVGKDGVAHRINAAAVALHSKMKVADFAQTDLAYAPPFGPVWDPLLTAANQLMKKCVN